MTDFSDLVARIEKAIRTDYETRKNKGNWAKHAAYAAIGNFKAGDAFPNGLGVMKLSFINDVMKKYAIIKKMENQDD